MIQVTVYTMYNDETFFDDLSCYKEGQKDNNTVIFRASDWIKLCIMTHLVNYLYFRHVSAWNWRFAFQKSFLGWQLCFFRSPSLHSFKTVVVSLGCTWLCQLLCDYKSSKHNRFVCVGHRSVHSLFWRSVRWGCVWCKS